MPSCDRVRWPRSSGASLSADVGLASASIRLAEDPEVLNTAGNPVHYLMFSWVGGLGEPAAEHSELTEVASITGVTFAVRREVWDVLGGFDADYVAYCEDVYLSLRAWQAGYRVVHEPRGRRAAPLRLRPELGQVLPPRAQPPHEPRCCCPERRTRRFLALPALVVEGGVLLVAVRDGWARDKVDGWRWLVTHRRSLADRRRGIQAGRTVPDRELARLLRGPLDPPAGLGPGVPAPVSRALARYWSWAEQRL